MNLITDEERENINQSSGIEAGSCSPNPTPKATPEVIGDGLVSPPKTKKQKALEKKKLGLKDLFIQEKRICLMTDLPIQ